MGIVRAVCISEKKGTQKINVNSAEFKKDFGIVGDAHAGNWHRQVSLLSEEKIEAFRQKGAQVAYGAFGENMVISEFDFASMPVGTIFCCNTVKLELTQIGKECHSHCNIYNSMGECIMPTQGVFAKVLQGGSISVGDKMMINDTMIDNERANISYLAAVVTLSDKGAQGLREDKSGALAAAMLSDAGYKIAESVLLADEKEKIKQELIRLSDESQVNLIITTGGTGFSERDCTPEATLEAATRNVPGIAEAIRAYSMEFTERAMLGRGVSVIRGKTLIVNLPGSPRAVKESLAYILPQLRHGIEILVGQASECGSRDL